MTEPIVRRAARVLLVNDAGELLLLHGRDPGRPGYVYWMTPGGGLDEGESPAAGAARELFEETGLRVAPADLGEPVWRENIEFPFDSIMIHQTQDFFLVRVPAWQVDTSGFDALERDTIDGHRWWSIADLERTSEHCYPEGLAALLRRLLEAA